MDGPRSVRCVDVLAFLTCSSQPDALRDLTMLEARHDAGSTRLAVAGALKCLTRHVPGARQAGLVADLTPTTSPAITHVVSAAQNAGLAPRTITTKLSWLGECFEFLREDGLMTPQPMLRRRHRLLTPTTVPTPMTDTDLAAVFNVIDAVRERLLFLLMRRCGLRVSAVCALTWAARAFHDGPARINHSQEPGARLTYGSPDVAHALKTWQAHQPTGQWLFPSRQRKGAPLQRSRLHGLLHESLQAATITTHASPHRLRHTFATP
jgi:site-specific recombinase XerD